MQYEKTAREWIVAERERKLRKRESKLAWMLAFKSGVRFEVRGDGYYTDIHMVSVAETDEQKAALTRAVDAKRDYLRAAAKAGALRAAMSRAEKTRPERNVELWRDYDALCALEEMEFNRSISKPSP